MAFLLHTGRTARRLLAQKMLLYFGGTSEEQQMKPAEILAHYREQFQRLLLGEHMQPEERAALATKCIEEMERTYGDPSPEWLADTYTLFCRADAALRVLDRVIWERRVKYDSADAAEDQEDEWFHRKRWETRHERLARSREAERQNRMAARRDRL